MLDYIERYFFITIGFIFISGLSLIFTGCPSPPLEKISRVSVLNSIGKFTPEDPNMVNFPVKVVFAIDDSGSMASTDPQDLRIDAVRQFADEYTSPLYENAWINIYLWGSETEEGTEQFTRDRQLLDVPLNAADSGSGTHYMNALKEMHDQIQSDIVKEEADEDGAARMKYIGIFLSDGEPTDDFSLADYVGKIQEIASMVKDSGSEFVLNTYLLATGLRGQSRSDAESLLTDMALAAEGAFTVLESADDIDFVNTIDMTVAIQYRLKYFFAFNYNARPGTDMILTDSDGDGLSDEEELNYGTDPQVKDTDNDGYSDYFEIVRSTRDEIYNPLVQDIPCDFVTGGKYDDTDMDGLTDCEETYLATDINNIDTDRDFIPDDIEFISGTSPSEPEDFNDVDMDGIGNRRELQLHTNPLSDDPLIHERHAYKYVLETLGSDEPDDRYYDFSVSNIKTVNTLGYYSDPVNRFSVLDPGENVVRFYYCQLPEDSTNLDDLIYRMAEVKVRFGDEVFEEFSQFDFMLLNEAK